MAAMPSIQPRLAVLSAAVALSSAAVAACSFAAVAPPESNGRYLLQLTPDQDFTPSDGRPMDVPAWRINAAIASQVISRFNPAQPPVIDYEHQTLHKEANGQPAPAAGWIHGLRWIEGRGLFAEAELTQRAKDVIASGEYRYFSPVFLYAPDTGEVLKVTMGALTNNPAVHGMQALNAMQAAASAQFSPTATAPNEDAMNLLQLLLASLGLPSTTDEKGAMAALTAVGSIKDLQAKAASGEAATQVATAACTALSLPADAKAEAVTAALTAAVVKPDPAKFVPVETVTAMQSQLAALTAKQLDADIDAAIKPALEDGRLLAAQEPWARDLGKSNMAALTAFLDKAPKIAALSGTQTQGHPPAQTAKGDAQLSPSELAVCTAMGMSPDQYKAGAA